MRTFYETTSDSWHSHLGTFKVNFTCFRCTRSFNIDRHQPLRAKKQKRPNSNWTQSGCKMTVNARTNLLGKNVGIAIELENKNVFWGKDVRIAIELENKNVLKNVFFWRRELSKWCNYGGRRGKWCEGTFKGTFKVLFDRLLKWKSFLKFDFRLKRKNIRKK